MGMSTAEKVLGDPSTRSVLIMWQKWAAEPALVGRQHSVGDFQEIHSRDQRAEFSKGYSSPGGSVSLAFNQVIVQRNQEKKMNERSHGNF